MENDKRYDDLFIFVPETGEIIMIAEGTGDNLLKEDIEEGYNDYIYYVQYEMKFGGINECDSGQLLMKEMFRLKYGCTEDCVPEVLNMAYGNPDMEYMVLKRKDGDR